MVNEPWVVESILQLQEGGTGGTTDYSKLTNKPTINGVTLNGDMTANLLSLASVLNGLNLGFGMDAVGLYIVVGDQHE